MANVTVTRNWFLASTATRDWLAPNEAWGRSHLYFDMSCEGVDAGFNVMQSKKTHIHGILLVISCASVFAFEAPPAMYWRWISVSLGPKNNKVHDNFYSTKNAKPVDPDSTDQSDNKYYNNTYKAQADPWPAAAQAIMNGAGLEDDNMPATPAWFSTVTL